MRIKILVFAVALALRCAPIRATDFLGMEMGATAINMRAGSSTFTTTALDSTTKRAAMVFQCHEAVTINKLGFRYGVRALTPPTYRISLQGVDTSGNPNNTVKQTGGVDVSATFTPPADTSWDNLTKATGDSGVGSLGANYPCSRGERLAIVIDYSSGSPDASNNSSFAISWPFSSNSAQSFPTAQTYNGSSWTKNGDAPVYFYTGTNNKTYGWPVITLVATARSSGAESGMFFALPASTFTTYTVTGIRVVIATGAPAKSFKVVLYSGNSPATVLQSVTVDSDDMSSPNSTQRLATFRFTDTTLATLTAGTTYRIGISPQDSSNNIAMYQYTLHDSQALTAFPGGSSWGATNRTGCTGACDAQSAVNFTDDSTARPIMSLLIGDASGGSGGGTRSYVGN